MDVSKFPLEVLDLGVPQSQCIQRAARGHDHTGHTDEHTTVVWLSPLPSVSFWLHRQRTNPIVMLIAAHFENLGLNELKSAEANVRGFLVQQFVQILFKNSSHIRSL